MASLRKSGLRIATLATVLLPALALAHPGHHESSSLAAGALHPPGGIDHVAAFILIGMLAAHLRVRHVVPTAAGLLGLLVTAWTSESDGWRYAAGFMLSSASLIAAGMTATSLVRLIAGAPRSPTSAAIAAPARRPSASR